ncbi:unnamed protein product [Gongylonema pulchrum]|uniref:Uncharacterized protein n=1 Tax=Gongylonema pulchrum TaxID=637853 RepID=A0A3P6QFD9_9BILA|nr:unnamed protein product [Gongylonema pulchrum]
MARKVRMRRKLLAVKETVVRRATKAQRDHQETKAKMLRQESRGQKDHQDSQASKAHKELMVKKVPKVHPEILARMPSTVHVQTVNTPGYARDPVEQTIRKELDGVRNRSIQRVMRRLEDAVPGATRTRVPLKAVKEDTKHAAHSCSKRCLTILPFHLICSFVLQKVVYDKLLLLTSAVNERQRGYLRASN